MGLMTNSFDCGIPDVVQQVFLGNAKAKRPAGTSYFSGCSRVS